MGCIALVRCVLVLRCGLLGWLGIRMQAEAVLQPAYGYHTTPANHNVTPIDIEPEQYNP